uniref:Secreted protein n=1 Tax=Eutreptiella gymnastica TaxID=73025 RepID=A0A7S4GDK2_9EUGL
MQCIGFAVHWVCSALGLQYLVFREAVGYHWTPVVGHQTVKGSFGQEHVVDPRILEVEAHYSPAFSLLSPLLHDVVQRAPPALPELSSLWMRSSSRLKSPRASHPKDNRGARVTCILMASLQGLLRTVLDRTGQAHQNDWPIRSHPIHSLDLQHRAGFPGGC